MLKSILIAAIALIGLNAAAADFPLCKDKRNVVSLALIGQWELDSAVTAKLYGAEKVPAKAEVTFTEDNSVLSLFDVIDSWAKCAYLAGRFTLTYEKHSLLYTQSSPFVVIEYAGTPMIVADERGYSGSGPLKDPHGTFATIAKGQDSKGDLFFWGGDHAHERNTAFKRK
jgi:hypothetical protein